MKKYFYILLILCGLFAACSPSIQNVANDSYAEKRVNKIYSIKDIQTITSDNNFKTTYKNLAIDLNSYPDTLTLLSQFLTLK